MLNDNKTNKLRFILPKLLFVLVIWAVYQLPFWSMVDEQYNDHWRRQIAVTSQPDERILIIEIDEKSLTKMESVAGRWPWPRSVHAFLVEGLLAAESAAIVFDILFSERDIRREEFDQHFAEVVHQQPHIFYAATLLTDSSAQSAISLANLPNDFFTVKDESANPAPMGNFVLPWIIDANDWNIGLINFLADDDGKARRYPVTTSLGEWRIHSLPGKVVTFIKQQNKMLAQSPLPDTIHLKYKSTQRVFNSISYADARFLLDNRQQLDLFRDKIVLIGATATGLHDLRPSPIDNLYPATSIIATAIDNLLNEDHLVLVDRNYGLTFLFFFIILMWGIFYLLENYRSQILMSVTLLIVTAGSLLLISLQLSKADMLFPSASVFLVVLFSVISVILYRGFSEYLSKRHTLQTFSRFMDPVVVKQLIAEPQWQDKLANKSTEVSVLFSDIRGFTSLSEKRSAEQIIQILNDYFDLQVETVFKFSGTLDKFIGDAIMAFWGAPIEDKRHAVNAVNAALTMVDNLLRFRDSLPEELKSFDVGIGVHSGPAVVGMLGSSKRYDYTAIGDTVNLASRIEGVTKGVARVLISESTKALCGDAFEYQFKGEYAVKGREEKVKLFEPVRVT